MPISVEALKCMQESKLFECRPQELDEKFVNRTIRKDETVYMPFACSSIRGFHWKEVLKLFEEFV